ncbi:MAG: outer membrane beta-barrel protein [Saprospiraceae bacterium]|nr:outer membrane beta-barrel protein [Saprospiraceae bacterium]
MKRYECYIKSLFLMILFFYSSHLALAQYNSAGIKVGVSNYSGDLDPDPRINIMREFKPAIGIFGRHQFNDYFGIRAGFDYCQISGNDDNNADTSRQKRNLSFKSNIFELNLLGECFFLGYQPYNLERIWSPYVFMGVSMFYFNPKALYKGNWVELQPLGTEGQGLASFPDREKYKRVQLSIPFGGGLIFALNEAWNIGIELGMRYTFTDYLDDVSLTYADYYELLNNNGELSAALSNRIGEYFGSTEPMTVPAGTGRGTPKNKDWYAIGGITLTYNFLDTGLSGVRKIFRKKTGCPTF